MSCDGWPAFVGLERSVDDGTRGRFGGPSSKGLDAVKAPPSQVMVRHGLGLTPSSELDVSVPVCQLVCGESHMATNLSIDPELIERALAVSGEKTKKAAVSRALEEFIARREQKKLLELFGSLEWDPAYDYKAERTRQ